MLVTSQETEREGSHGYRDVWQTDLLLSGGPWSESKRIENLRRKTLPNGDDLAIGDVCPKWHAKTQTVLATGKTFTFHDGKREDRLLERVSYSVFTPKRGESPSGEWSGLQLLDLPATDHAGMSIISPNSGCCQRFDLPDGNVLLPIRYRRDAKSSDYTTLVALCRFDGKTLTYVRHGSELTRTKNRGYGEPSLTRFQKHFYLTLRSDDTGFVARSSDGLSYESPVEWKYDDGAVLGNYNTQQHWVTHRDGLYLVYTRRNADNDHIFRHRAPLFIAQVDPERLCVIRATEQILVPQNHADLGNFGVLDVNPQETWVVVAEYPAIGKRKSEQNEVMVAKLIWSQPNTTLIPTLSLNQHAHCLLANSAESQLDSKCT